MDIDKVKSENVLAEFIGTLFLSLSVFVFLDMSLKPYSVWLGVSLTMLFISLILIPYSGAHANPAITLSEWANHRKSTISMLCIIVAQMAAGLLGLAIFAFFKEGEIYTQTTDPNVKLFAGQFLGALILGFAYGAIAFEKHTTLEKAFLIGAGTFCGLAVSSLGGCYSN